MRRLSPFVAFLPDLAQADKYGVADREVGGGWWWLNLIWIGVLIWYFWNRRDD